MNTAKWAVDGLKAAGLNPILAAQNPNMSSNLGNASPSTTAVSSGKNSGVRGAAVSSGSGGASRNFAAISQIMNSSKQIEMQENLQKAQIDNINADTVQKRMGDTSWGNNLLAVGNVLDSVGLKEPLKKMAVKAADWMTSQLGIGGDGNSAHSDALKRRADEVYNPLTDASRRGIIDDDSLDKINAAGHSRDAEMSPRERERERRLRNGRRIMRQRQYNGGRPNDF